MRWKQTILGDMSKTITIDLTAADPKNPELSIQVSGPELHTRGTPRRRRRTFCVRLGIRADGVAAGGCCMFDTEAEATEYFNRKTAPSN